MPIATDPMPDVLMVSFQADLDHGFSFEINGTHLTDGLRPAIEMVNQGIAMLEADPPEPREVMAWLVAGGRSRQMSSNDLYMATSHIQYLFDSGHLEPTEYTCIRAGYSRLRNMRPVGTA